MHSPAKRDEPRHPDYPHRDRFGNEWWTPDVCTHCGQPISRDKWPVHLAGDYRGKHSCSPGDSGLPYGYEAHPADTPCAYPCLGANRS
jgi:hypothetical protein